MSDVDQPLPIALRIEEVEDSLSGAEDQIQRLKELVLRLAESFVVHAAIGIPGAPIEQATYPERINLLDDARTIAGEIRRLHGERLI